MEASLHKALLLCNSLRLCVKPADNSGTLGYTLITEENYPIHRKHRITFELMISNETIVLANKLWDYLLMNHPLEKTDCILVLGSHDTRVAERAAQLYLQGWAPLLIFSGGLGNFTKSMWTETEADKFARMALQLGVPAHAIMIENKSTNTAKTFCLPNSC